MFESKCLPTIVVFCRMVCLTIFICHSSPRSATQHRYNSHNLYGLMESIATKQAVRQIRGNKRPFVLTRSTFVSAGHHVFHWTGDNSAHWEDLRGSINTVGTMTLLGLSMTGADICGEQLLLLLLLVRSLV